MCIEKCKKQILEFKKLFIRFIQKYSLDLNFVFQKTRKIDDTGSEDLWQLYIKVWPYSH